MLSLARDDEQPPCPSPSPWPGRSRRVCRAIASWCPTRRRPARPRG